MKWPALVVKLGLSGLHFHDLRHAGNIWASKAGMSTKDLMARMGHDDIRAALIYQRATSDADRLIAERLSDLVDEHHHNRRTTTARMTVRPARWSRSRSCCAVAARLDEPAHEVGTAAVWALV